MAYKSTYAPNRATKTVPNQCLTVNDILDRFVRGQAVSLYRESNDDPQGLSEEEQMQLHEVEDEFERMDILMAIEDGTFNEPPKYSSAGKAISKKSTDSEVVERADSSKDIKNESVSQTTE